MPTDPHPPTGARPGVPDKDWLVARADRLGAEAISSTSLDQPEDGPGYTAVEPDLSVVLSDLGLTEDDLDVGFTHEDARNEFHRRKARGQIAAIIAMSDDGTDMLDEIMSGPVAALVDAAEQRERERLADEVRTLADESFNALSHDPFRGWRSAERLRSLADGWIERGSR